MRSAFSAANAPDCNAAKSGDGQTWQPRFDVGETERAILITAELPGVSPEHVKVSIDESLLKVSGEKRGSHEPSTTIRQYHTERNFGKFERVFRLPETIDVNGITASNKDGVLTLTLPKQPKAQPREIAISAV